MLARLLLCFAFFSCLHTSFVSAQTRIVSLSPHLTEWVYTLGAENNLVAVSSHSDYPEAAKQLPVVADYQGVNLAALVHLQPTLVLVWAGGNKPQDIARIKQMGIAVFSSQPKIPEDISAELTELAKLLGKTAIAEPLITNFNADLKTLRDQYSSTVPVQVFYYSWQSPLITIGRGAWGNQLLSVCGASTVFKDSPVDYPTVSIQQVMLNKPDVILSVSDQPENVVRQFWHSHNLVLQAKIMTANPDVLSRYTLRLMPELTALCEKLHATI